MDELTLLKPKLIRLKLSGILESLEDRLSQSLKEKWSHTRFLLTLMTDEVDRRENKQMERRFIKSGLETEKTIEAFDFTFNPKIHEPTIHELTSCRFLEKKDGIFFLGPSGVGKSHLAQALGHMACRKGYEVLYRRTFTLLQWIHSGKGDGTYQRRLQQVIKVPLLILDDFGLKPLTIEQQSDLYEIICERYEKASTIITSNRDLNEWPAIFTNPLMGSAAMDRLIHRAIKIIIEDNSKSYRRENFVARSKDLTEYLKK